MSKISGSIPGGTANTAVASDAASLDALAQAEQEAAKAKGAGKAKRRDDQKTASAEDGAKKTSQKGELSGAHVQELDQLAARLEVPGGFFAALVAASERQLESQPKGASPELIKELTALVEALPAEPPADVPEAFRLDLAGHALPGLLTAPKEAAGLLSAHFALSESHAARLEKSPRLELIKAYVKLLHAGYDKQQHKAEATNHLAQTFSQGLREKLEKAAPEVARVYKGFLDKSLFVGKRAEQLVAENGAAATAKMDEIELPAPELAQLERIFSELGPLLRQSWKLQKAAPEFEKVRLHLEKHGSSGNETANGSNADTSGTADNAGTKRDNSNGTPSGNFIFPPGVGLGGQRGLPGDIESLIIVVMMNATKTESDILRDQLNEMSRITAQKKQLREAKTKMKQESARLDSQMRQEFNALKNQGQLHSSVTFDDYKAWRQCQWGDVREDAQGNLMFPPAQLEQPIPTLPDWMIYGPEAAEEAAATAGTNNSAASFGLPPKVAELLKKLWQALPEPRPASFEEYLSELGMWPVQSVPDDINKNLEIARAQIEGYRAANPTPESGPVLTVDQFAVPGGATYELMKKFMYMDVLAAAGVPGAAAQRDALKSELDKALAGSIPAPPADAAVFAAHQAAVSAASTEVSAAVNKLAAIYNAWKSGGPGPAAEEAGVNGNLEALIKDQNDGADGDLEDTFMNGGKWVPGYDSHNEQGMSKPTGFSFGSNGLKGKGWREEDDDANSSGYFSCDFGSPSTLDALADALGQLGQSIPSDGSSMADFQNALNGMQTALAGLNGKVGLTGQTATTEHLDANGNPVMSDAELDGMDSYINDLLGDLGSGSGAYWNWVQGQDYDGKAAAKKAQAEQDAASAKAAQEAANQKEAAGKPRTADGTILENEGTLAEFDGYIQEIDDKLATLSELGEIEMIRMQALVDRRAKFIEALSNLIAKESKLRESINSNLK